MKDTPFTLPVCICPAALTVVVKLVIDAHCAEKSLNTREFIFLEDFHRRFTMKLISSVVMKMSIQSLDLRFAM